MVLGLEMALDCVIGTVLVITKTLLQKADHVDRMKLMANCIFSIDKDICRLVLSSIVTPLVAHPQKFITMIAE